MGMALLQGLRKPSGVDFCAMQKFDVGAPAAPKLSPMTPCNFGTSLDPGTTQEISGTHKLRGRKRCTS